MLRFEDIVVMSEQERCSFLLERDGIEGALEFGKQTIFVYRKFVTQRMGMCGDRQGRIKYVRSYLFWKRFIRENEI